MKINEILKNKKTLSFEVFPPKKAEIETQALFNTIQKLKEFNPDFISVTYGASGSNSRNAVEIAKYIKSLGLNPLAHLTGGPSTPEDIERVTSELQEGGIENILALRGDKPLDYTDEFCKYYKHATDLMDVLKNKPFSVGAACYPEGHMESASFYDDLKNLKKKEEQGASFFITQIFYNNEYYYRLINEAKNIGIKSPIIPGIMPLVNIKNIQRIKNMCGSTIPLEFRNMIEKYQDNPNVIEEVGYNYAVYQIIDLIAKGAPGIHLYIMNNAKTAIEICSRLKNTLNELF